jgi:hypothetical protein
MIEAPLILVAFPVAVVWLVWMIFFLSNHPGDEILSVQRHQFLGPGGPDDPFANDPYDRLPVPQHAQPDRQPEHDQREEGR